jgi:RNA polymerase sigma-70 factor (ECF subfamily)
MTIALPDQELRQDLAEVYREHYRMAYRTAYAITGSSEDAEDAVQTIFLRLTRREFPPDLNKNPRAYLYRAAVNLALNIIRERKRRTSTSISEGTEPDIRTLESETAEEIHRRLYEAVAELSPQSTHILLLRYVHDYSDAEIARLLGTSRGTIAVSLYRSRARLRKLMRTKGSSFGGRS